MICSDVVLAAAVSFLPTLYFPIATHHIAEVRPSLLLRGLYNYL
jgi:hypothetical protein